MATKIKQIVLFSFVLAFPFFYFSQTLIINELSQGPSGAKEFVEFLVVPTGVINPCQQNASCLDMRGWIFDDNNSYFTPGNTSGVGLAQGALRFSNSAFWSCIPVGTLIVVYNDGDINASLPGNDVSMADGNCRLVIPASSGLIEVNVNNPSAASPLVYPFAGWTPGGIWTTTGMANGGDSYQIYSPLNTNIPAFAVSWGNNSSNTIIYFVGPATGTTYYFNSNTNNPFLQGNWSSASSAGGDTPGAGNNANNIAYINSLTNNCSPFQPLLANPSAVNSLCACNGSVNAAPTGGAGYTYQWTNALGQNIGATASVSNLCAGWYYVQVGSGACTINDSVQIIDNGIPVVPSFSAMGPYCLNGVPGILPNASNNGINGTWNPPLINTSVVGNATYTFTPAAGQCASNATLTVNTTNSVNPTFTAMGPYCLNGVPGILPNASNNGINGTWNPPIINTSVVGNATYTFTPAAGQCASSATLTVNTTNSINPTFTAMGPYCLNGVPGILPNASNNGINGTWNPPIINTSVVGNATYTFTPAAGQCASNATLTVNTTNSVNPTFTAMGPYCVNSAPGILPNISNNGINGTWNPPVINTVVMGNSNYVFTPAAGQCGDTAMLTINVDNQVLPVFNPQGPFCLNTNVPNLPNTSANGISGTWIPPVVNTSNIGSTVYTFIPNVGQCGDTNILQIQIVDSIQPNFNVQGPYCLNEVAPNLPGTSLNGINGTWNPPMVNTLAIGTTTYTFTPSNAGCATNANVDITINSIGVFAGNDTTLCSGQTLVLTANGANTYVWNNGVVNGVSFMPVVSGNYIVCGTVGACSACDTLVVTLIPTPNVSFGSVVNGNDVQYQYTGSLAQGYQWNFGDGNSSNMANPLNTYALSGVYNVTLTANNGPCVGSATNQVIVYGPESVIEPINVITPNGDNVNDVFDLNLVGYKNLQGVILNRWGNVMAILTLGSMTWDGTSNGKLADEGVYFYQFEVEGFSGKKDFHQGFLHLYR
jgi:gliding motility-associated-like protein